MTFVHTGALERPTTIRNYLVYNYISGFSAQPVIYLALFAHYLAVPEGRLLMVHPSLGRAEIGLSRER